jgi:hypothetical protein
MTSKNQLSQYSSSKCNIVWRGEGEYGRSSVDLPRKEAGPRKRMIPGFGGER